MGRDTLYVLIGGVIVLVVGTLFILGIFPIPKPEPPTEEIALTKQPTEDKGELVIEDIEEGTGEEVQSGDTVRIHYTGTLTDGTKFDSSVDRGEPFETPIGEGAVIEGWDKGVVGMKVGGKRKLTIPPSMAYGDSELPGIPAGSTLIFDVELIEIVE